MFSRSVVMGLTNCALSHDHCIWFLPKNRSLWSADLVNICKNVRVEIFTAVTMKCGLPGCYAV
jgi:hypothetical protein